ncbi:aldo/keto reductase [Parasphingorhabdus sp.]|uniref:aldo/keto reductase n=1 Tax=Parasphingorhabdus sp. TaxID=2709688 RepID=UPI0032638A0E
MTKPLIILQARTSSRRLPAKSLVSFRGYPLAILAALRAATGGNKVILATSDDSSDDMLAAAAEKHKIECVRGSLENVLTRFREAIQDVPDETPVVRLTGDNLVPDGALICEIIDELRATGAGYITSGHGSGLPYGVSVEVTYARHLRAADREATTDYEREHVTTWVRANQGVTVFSRYASMELGQYRLTVDSLDDLASINQVFPETDDPISVPWREIVSRAHLGLYQPGSNVVGEDMVLGTAQLGMPYGVNRAGSPTGTEAQTLIRTAIANGVEWLDTARVYGNSESVLGQVLGGGWDGRCRVVTKLDTLNGWGASESEKGVRAASEVSLLTSLRELRVSRLDAVLLHRADHWAGWSGAVANLLQEWRASDRIGAIGVSVQSPEELKFALAESAISHIQMPFSILDHRWSGHIDAIEQAKAERPLTIHLRSALLQGLLLSNDPALWRRAHVSESSPIIGWLADKARDYAQSDIAALCLNWCRAQRWSDGVVVGMDNIEQLNHNLAIFSAPVLPPHAIDEIIANRPQLATHSLDPAQWKHGR